MYTPVLYSTSFSICAIQVKNVDYPPPPPVYDSPPTSYVHAKFMGFLLKFHKLQEIYGMYAHIR